MRTRRVHPVTEKLILAASENKLSELRKIIKKIPTLAKIREKELKLNQELNIEDQLPHEITIDSQNKERDNALTSAAWYGNEEIVQELLHSKADPNIKGYAGSTALIMAAMEEQINIASQLIQAKAGINIQNDYKNTALIKAAEKNNLKMMELLLSANADLGKRGAHDKTALTVAVRCRNFEAVNFLLSQGAILHDPEELYAMLIQYDCYTMHLPGRMETLATFVQQQTKIRETKEEKPTLTEEHFQKIKHHYHYLKVVANYYRNELYSEIDKISAQKIPNDLIDLICDYDAHLERASSFPIYNEEKQEVKQNEFCSIM